MITKKKKGKLGYIPTVIIDELEDIKREDGIPLGHGDNAQAFRKMANYTRVGREAKRIIQLDFGGAKKQKPVNSYYPKKKKKKGRGMF